MPTRNEREARAITEKEEAAWLKLLQKLQKHQLSGGTMIMTPDEVVLLNLKLVQITSQLLGMMKWADKFGPLIKTIAEAEENVEPGTVQDVRAVQSNDGVDPQDLHNTLTPERSDSVAGGA